MTSRLFAGVVLYGSVTLALGSLSGCGGSSGSPSPSPATPSPVVTGGGASNTITIVGTRGAQSFTPDPANIGNGATFAWKNNDGVTHHIVFDDDSVDSGVLAPGAVSPAITMRGNGARYHCTIHPSMVGSINMENGNPPPCSGVYCESSK